MKNLFHYLRRTGRIDAPVRCLAFRSDDLFPARGTNGWKLYGFLFSGSLFQHNFNNFGDNVTGAAHMVAGDRNDIFGNAVIEFLSRAVPVGGMPLKPAHEPHPHHEGPAGDINDVP